MPDAVPGPQRSSALSRLDQLVGCGRPQQPALTYKSTTVSYGELAEQVGETAAGLRAL